MEQMARLREINLGSIVHNPYRSRTFIDAIAVREMADSILTVSGIIYPVILQQAQEKGKLELVAGECRLLATKLAGFTKVPGWVFESDSLNSLRLVLLDNLQRGGFTYLEEGRGFQIWCKKAGFPTPVESGGPLSHRFFRKIASMFTVSTSYITRRIELLELTREAQNMVEEGKLDPRAALELRAVKDVWDQCKVVKAIKGKRLTTMTLRRYIKQFKLEKLEHQKKLMESNGYTLTSSKGGKQL